jgi:hypothetical protein
MVWFDAGELSEMPTRSASSLAAEKWADELRQVQRRREDSAFYDRVIRRHPMRFPLP